MHIKALIADDTVLTGTYNYSKSATNRNDENFFVIKDRYALQAHLAKFDQLWVEKLPPVSPEIKKRQKRAPLEFTAYVTRTGKKYHRLGCRYLRKSSTSISSTEAKR